MSHEVLLNQVCSFRNTTLEILKSIPEEIADIIPPGHNNSIRWNLGHIFVDQELWLYFKIKDEMKLPPGYLEMFNHGTRPSDWKDSPPTLNELAYHLEKQAERIVKNLGHRLDEPLIEPTELGMSTIGQIIPRTLFHEGWHIGIILSMKRQIEASRSFGTSSIESIPCVNLPVSNVARSVEWWIQHFDVQLSDKFIPGSHSASLRVNNGQWIFLWKTKHIQNQNHYTQGAVMHSDNSQIYTMTLNIKGSKEVEILYQKLKENGVRVGTLREAYTGKAFDCYDLDGNKFNVWGGEWKE